MGNPGDEGEYQPTTKNVLIFLTIKILLNKFTSSTIKSAIPSPSNSNFHLINLHKFHLQLSSLLLYQFFLTSGFMYAHVMLILINQYLLNVVFSIYKSIEWSNFSQEHFYYPPPSMIFGKTLLLLMLVFSTDPTPVGTFFLIKYNGFQISGNISDETPYLLP